ncbi:ABC transporter ATP-binding protein [Paenibacillus sp.]|uniref:ABC transporter ATP-binding protein n=1 Tax=Paenibacillus sp. TaxID=58172 RepID=UPI002811FF63|nr:ABC transporter ATP-binding protein [Paenibacillus sp.]
MSILEVNDLSIAFKQYAGGLRQRTHQVISRLNLSMNEGEIVAVVGASGSGKSLLAHAVLGILPDHATVSGTIRFAGEELTPKRQAALRGKELALVPQSINFLDPLMRVGTQVRTSVRTGDPVAAQRNVFERYRLKPETEKLFPFQLSGGMARRALVSMAVVSGARVIIADEPTPGLDPAALTQALGYFRELADQGAAVMLITHDIEAALAIADKIAVFYAGTTVEIAPAADFSGNGERLRHPYTEALWRALPQNEFLPLPGDQPSSENLPPGCPFEPRCDKATSECAWKPPLMRQVRNGSVWCDHVS